MATEPEISIAEELLQRAHSPGAAASLYRNKVQLRPLILRPTSPDRNRNARSKRQYERLQKAKARRKSNKPKPLSAKQKRGLGVYEIPKDQQKYAIYVPLHQLWCEYMREILGVKNDGDDKSQQQPFFVSPEGAGPMLVTADYHGAKLEVVRSRCVSRVGLKGIVVKDTKFTFDLITEKDEIKCVPKEGTVFRFEVPPPMDAADENKDGMGEGESNVELNMEVDEKQQQQQRRPLVFEIYGDRFKTRAPERAVKKVRLHIDPNL